MAERSESDRTRAGDAGDRSSSEGAAALGRLAFGGWRRSATWAVNSTLRLGESIVRGTLAGESPAKVIDDARAEVVDGFRRLLGTNESETAPWSKPRPEDGDEEDANLAPLRARGEALLSRSAEVESDSTAAHPSYARILGQLAPDEARILRLLAVQGPQAAVDVRTWRPLGVGSHVATPGLTMIDRHAGCLYADRVPAYLSNLYRLGLIWFSRDPMRDQSVYQVLEAQPEVLEALERGGRKVTLRRSIELTPFGEHFCATCLPLDDFP
jgi:hypothetical protein